MENLDPQFSAGSDELWCDLANAVVIDAVKQYRKLRKKLRAGADLKPTEMKELKEIEEFFHSQWFEFLTDVDGFELLRQLQAEARPNPIYPPITPFGKETK